MQPTNIQLKTNDFHSFSRVSIGLHVTDMRVYFFLSTLLNASVETTARIIKLFSLASRLITLVFFLVNSVAEFRRYHRQVFLLDTQPGGGFSRIFFAGVNF